jgi:hypothetical protein
VEGFTCQLGAWKNVIRRIIVLLAVICVLVTGAFAQGAALTTPGNQSLPNLYQTGKRYTLRLQYVDPKGDDVTKAIFHDESRSGNIDVPMKAIDGSSADGATVTWEVNGFEKGDHKGYFVVTTETGSTRYPQAPDTFYEFKVHSVIDKWILVGVSILLCFTLIPWVVYTVVRSINRRGSPSSAAKVGLMVGALGSLTMFVWQFLGIYDNPLIWILAGVVFIVIVVGVLARR